ncbi:MAG TPA: hypothetical protein VGC29_08895, partial [Flavisolibacter sp.]
FVNNARRVIRETVEARSHGKLKLELKQVSFHFLSSELQVKTGTLVSTDTVNEDVSYRIGFDKISIKVGSFWPILFNKKIAIDSVEVNNPQIHITQVRIDTTKKRNEEEISIPRQMGQLYHSVLDGLDAFGIKRMKISNARLSLSSKLKPNQQPVVISGIQFNLLKKPGMDKPEVDLYTARQNIALPGGKHHLAFQKFHLNLLNDRMQLDSCTVTAVSKDSVSSRYHIFFDQLLLVGVDFNAMYRYNLIKADSVYCEKPLFDIQIQAKSASAPKKERPDPEKIIQELTGDLDLAFIGVKHAGIRINITGDATRSLFNSNQDDFEMRGLRIYADSAQPVSIDRFDMLVRDYKLYNEDSSAVYTFDSIHFQNNKITLNNFWVTTTSSRGKARSERDFRIPRFELTGLDWYHLIFNENLVAREAVLYNPVIKYTKRQDNPVEKTNIFKALRIMDNFMTLDKISLLSGQLDMQLNSTTSLKIRDANISLNQFTDDLTSLREAITTLSFTHADIQLGDLNATIHDARYLGKELVRAGLLTIANKNRSILSQFHGVTVNNVLVNQNSQSIVVDGLHWQKANIHLDQPVFAKANNARTFRMSNSSGLNTRFFYSNNESRISANIASLVFDSLDKTGKDIHLSGFQMKGEDFRYNSPSILFRSSAYHLSGDGRSILDQVYFKQQKQNDSIELATPLLAFQSNINHLLNGKMDFGDVAIQQAFIRINKETAADTVQNGNLPGLSIRSLNLTQPDLHISISKDGSTTQYTLPVSEQGQVLVRGLEVDNGNISMQGLSLKNPSAYMVKDSGDLVGVEKGEVDIELSSLKFGSQSLPGWSFMVNKLHLVNPNRIPFNNGNLLELKQATLGGLQLSSQTLTDPGKLIRENISAWMRGTTGHYTDSNSTFKWFNASYNPGQKSFTLDSFQYYPSITRDSFVSRSEFQKDYITLKTGLVKMNGFSTEKFEKDSSLIADTIEIQEPHITIYRDKSLPFKAGVLKPMPVDMIGNISMPVDVMKLKMVNGLLEYTEKNAKTGAEGTLSLNGMNAEISHLKNRGITGMDSLSILMDARLMDSALLNLRVRQSYQDSLKGFVMTLRLKPTSVSLLNPVLVPFSNVLITSGAIDSFYLRALGWNDLAVGEMQMFYHDLRIRLIKDGNTGKQSLADRIGNFLVNSFVIRKNNKGRTGMVYYEREKDRSFFNYLVKMTFSGMATSIGVKKNKKYMKEYREQLEKVYSPWSIVHGLWSMVHGRCFLDVSRITPAESQGNLQ